MNDIFDDNDEKLTKGQKTAAQILEAAARCILKIGIEKTSVTNIALEAGVKRSLIAYHFPKKAEIFQKVIIHIMREIDSTRENQVDGTHGRERLTILMKTYFEFFAKNPHYFSCFIHFHYLATIDEAYTKLSDHLSGTGIHQISKCLNELLSAHQISVHHSFIDDFSEMLYQNLLGSIIRRYTSTHQLGDELFKEQYITTLRRQIDLFLVLVKEESKKHSEGFTNP